MQDETNSQTETKDETIRRLRNEVRGWKDTSRREALLGLIVGGFIGLIIGYITGMNN